MATKLKNLKITKVSLVDEGACSAAHITLFKQKEGGKTMTFEEVMKSLTDEQQATIQSELTKHTDDLAKYKADVETATEELEKAKKDKADLETKVSELEAAAEVDKSAEGEGETEEDVLKNVDPAVREMLQKARNEAEVHKMAVLKMKEEKETAELTDVAKSINGVGTEETQLVSMLKKAKNADVELYNEILKAFEVANNLIKDSEVMKQAGQDGGTDTDPNADAWEKFDAKTEEIAKLRNISKAKATSAVMTEFPELYYAYLDSCK